MGSQSQQQLNTEHNDISGIPWANDDDNNKETPGLNPLLLVNQNRPDDDSGSVMLASSASKKSQKTAKNTVDDTVYHEPRSQFKWKKEQRVRRERFLLSLRAPTTLNQFQSLTQSIMDAWSRVVDTTTASETVISKTLNSIINGLQQDAARGIITTAFFMFAFILLAGVTPSLLFCCYLFTKPKKSSSKFT